MLYKFMRYSVCIIMLVCPFLAYPKSPILFVSGYISGVWGYVNDGWFIDSLGNIRSYSFQLSDSMGFTMYLTVITQAYLDKMYALSKATGKTVSIDTLHAMTDLLPSASQGEVSGQECADFGNKSYFGIWFNPVNSYYQRIVCYQAGDLTGCNSSSSAKAIARWLISLDSLPPRTCLPPDYCLNPVSIIKNNVLPKNRTPDLKFHDMYYINGKKALQSNKKDLLIKKDNLIIH